MELREQLNSNIHFCVKMNRLGLERGAASMSKLKKRIKLILIILIMFALLAGGISVYAASGDPTGFAISDNSNSYNAEIDNNHQVNVEFTIYIFIKKLGGYTTVTYPVPLNITLKGTDQDNNSITIPYTATINANSAYAALPITCLNYDTWEVTVTGTLNGREYSDSETFKILAPSGFEISDNSNDYTADISDNHQANQSFPIYFFIKNSYPNSMTVNYDVSLTVTLEGHDQNNNSITIPYTATISANTAYVTLPITCLNYGSWTVTVSGDLPQDTGNNNFDTKTKSKSFSVHPPRDFTIQDTAPDFVHDGSIANAHWTNVPFYTYVFITDSAKNMNVIVPYDVTVSGTIKGKDLNNDNVTLPVSLTIPANQSYGSVVLTLPYLGNWTMRISGDLKQQNGSWNTYTGSIVIPIANLPQGTSLRVTPANTDLSVGATSQLIATLVNNEITLVDITNFANWTSSNTARATVGTSGNGTPGLVTGVSAGSATVTASLAGLSGIGNVTVAAVGGISFRLQAFQDSSMQTSIGSNYVAGKTFYIAVTALNENGTTNTDTYYSIIGLKTVTVNILSSDTQNNQNTLGSITDVLGSPGVGIIGPLSYNDIDTLHYWSVNDLTPSPPSTSIDISFNPDHFGIVDINGILTNPVLQLRPDFPNTGQTWGYIGENMIITVGVQAFSFNNLPAINYQWNTNWFITPSVWNINLTAESGNPVSSRIFVSPLVSDPSMVNGVPTLQAIITVRLDKGPLNEAEYVNNFTISLDPRDAAGIGLTTSASAIVTGSNGPYNMYGGRIRVANGYYSQPDAQATVTVERYQGGFITNTDDSKTQVTQWSLEGNPVNDTTLFTSGTGQISITNNISNISLKLTPSNYPDYMGVVTGTDTGNQTWGQIVLNPVNPAPITNGPLWKREILPE